MSWKLKQKLTALLETEDGAIVREWGGKTSIALVYPNTYSVGMGNLAIHSLYRMLGTRPGIVCERAFLPDPADEAEYRRTGAPLMSLESQRPLAEFDIVAFSISFENDFLNLLPILELARIPYKSDERGKNPPLLIAGGAAPTLNPMSIAPIFDAMVLGEAEGFAEDLFPLLEEAIPKDEKVKALGRIKGIYVPQVSPALDFKSRRHIEDLDAWPTETTIHSHRAQFGNMHLIEIQRGCPYRCRFCATPELYHPPRKRSATAVLKMVDEGLAHRKIMGLVGAHILSHPDFVEIAQGIHARGATFSPSSVRADDIDGERAALLAQSGHRSVALGIEAGSERLRNKLGKKISDRQVLDAVATLAQNGITRIRLYFMIGLPGETEDDIAAIAELSRLVLEASEKNSPPRKQRPAVDLTVAPFVPKPGTPFADEPFAGEDAIKQKIAALKKILGRRRGIKIHHDAPASAAIEALLSQGGLDAFEFLEDAHKSGNSRRSLLKFV